MTTSSPSTRVPCTVPVELPLRGHRVTVVGATARAAATVAELIEAGALVTVIGTDTTPYLSDLAERGLATVLYRSIQPGDIDSAAMIFASTDDDEHNRWIAETARERAVLCIVDNRPTGRRAGRPGMGRVILVGGGPGDPSLLTVAGRDAIVAADTVVTDRLAPVSALKRLAPHADIIDVSKIPGGRRTEQWDINAMLVSRALEGQVVVRLKGGDGFVFGRGGEELDHCVQAGVPVEVIPGVSSAIAAPASALIPVTHRGLTQGFTVVSGHVPPGHPECTVDYAALAHANTTLVLMMAVANLPAIAAALTAAGMDPATPAAVVADGSLSSQHEVRGTLGTIAGLARAAGIEPPATTVIGAVAGFVPGRAPVQQIVRSHA
ncbi:uroporphyrinogen-III C-methyltransferase [Mycolicibacterium sp. 22603]|uniref:uroporphyrinogen-III C-methyltransferase n=1 Tax=Mycolicibacterium sp. 22603 TaxID=3453950 RepID=UPI003F82619B